jgi:hypothetical protein
MKHDWKKVEIDYLFENGYFKPVLTFSDITEIFISKGRNVFIPIMQVDLIHNIQSGIIVKSGYVLHVNYVNMFPALACSDSRLI